MTCLFCGYILLVFSVFRMAAEHVECFVPQALKCLEKTFLLFKMTKAAQESLGGVFVNQQLPRDMIGAEGFQAEERGHTKPAAQVSALASSSLGKPWQTAVEPGNGPAACEKSRKFP